jgi:hypothetical protein
VVVRLLGFYQWIRVNKRGVVTGVGVSESNRCAVEKLKGLRIKSSGTTHAKDQVRIAKNAILID